MKSYSEYRAMARESLKGHWNEMAVLALLLFVVSGIGSTPSYIAEFAKIQWLNLVGSSTNALVSLLVMVPLSFAFYNLCLSFARREERNESPASSLFHEFTANWINYVESGFLMGLIIVLLLIPTLMIGSIIFGLAYELVPFIIRDTPSISATEALRTSRIMMRGHKWELFVLNLTFLGWVLLCILTCGIGFLWLMPYVSTAKAHFYEDVKAEYEERLKAEC